MCFGLASIAISAAPEPVEASETGQPSSSDITPTATSKIHYGKRGLEFQNPEDDTFLWFGVRLQIRWTDLSVEQGKPPSEAVDTNDSIKLNRGRLKLGGHLYKPWLDVYSEYDFSKDQLLDYRATVKARQWLVARIGQWKSDYNRARIDSSGAQQFVERSQATYWFTIDRQKGLSLSGRAGAGTLADSSWWLQHLSGTGRGGPWFDGKGLWLARYQWNLLGRVLGFSESDILRQSPPAASIAVATVDGYSRYTRFSSFGGEELPGYAIGQQDQYHLRQFVFETAWQGYGFSWQQEHHWKNITNRLNGKTQRLHGGYAQMGYFFSEIWPAFPRPLELAVRYSLVDPNREAEFDEQKEFSFAANWFFAGHRNKLTLGYSVTRFREKGNSIHPRQWALQWDVSF